MKCILTNNSIKENNLKNIAKLFRRSINRISLNKTFASFLFYVVLFDIFMNETVEEEFKGKTTD